MHVKVATPDPNVTDCVAQVLADGYREDKDGLIYRDYTEGGGEMPSDGQEVHLILCCRPGACAADPTQ